MMNKKTFYKLALNSLYYSGAYNALKNRYRGVGALLTLHHVKPGANSGEFSPNRILEITPEFLEETIRELKRLGYEIISLCEFRRRLAEGNFRTPFVCFTLDDGYADNYLYAYPIFSKYRAPFAIYVCTGLLDGSIDLWWQCLEEIVAHQSRIELSLEGTNRVFPTETAGQKDRAFNSIYWALRRMPLEKQLQTLEALKERYAGGVPAQTSSSAPLSWDMIAEMQASGFLTVGAHTKNHFALSKLSPRRLREEVEFSRDLIEQRTGMKPRHFAYPYGDALSAATREFAIAKELGFSTAVTTRKGVIVPEHARHMHALPRISLNGDYQQLRNVRLFMSGLPFALARGFRRLDVN